VVGHWQQYPHAAFFSFFGRRFRLHFCIKNLFMTRGIIKFKKKKKSKIATSFCDLSVTKVRENYMTSADVLKSTI
jgi:hypothetical protein